MTFAGTDDLALLRRLFRDVVRAFIEVPNVGVELLSAPKVDVEAVPVPKRGVSSPKIGVEVVPSPKRGASLPNKGVENDVVFCVGELVPKKAVELAPNDGVVFAPKYNTIDVSLVDVVVVVFFPSCTTIAVSPTIAGSPASIDFKNSVTDLYANKN